MNREQKTGIRDQRTEIRDQGPVVASSSEFEETLRLLASLPAPDGLEERVETGLKAAPRAATGKARILRWPATRCLENSWARAAAAAAIVAVVVGGGWGICSLVQPSQPARAIAAPPRVVAPSGGFSNAGAMRTPQTLNGPIVAPPTVAKPATVAPPAAVPAAQTTSKPVAQPKAQPDTKIETHSSQKLLHPAKPTQTNQSIGEPAALPAK
jgi:hypothetical protein